MTKAKTNKQTNKLHVELYKVNYDGGLADPLSFIAFGILGDKPILEMDVQVQEGEPYSVLFDFAEAYGCLYLRNTHGGKQRVSFNPEEVNSTYEAVKNGGNSKLIASDASSERVCYGFIPSEVEKDRRVEVLANIVFMRFTAPSKLWETAKKGLFKNVDSRAISISAYLYSCCPNDKGFYNDKFCEHTCDNLDCLAKTYFPANCEEENALFRDGHISEEDKEELSDELKDFLNELDSILASKKSHTSL